MKLVRLVILAVSVGVAGYLLIAPSFAKPGGPAGTKGKYDIIFAGGFSGTGTAQVNPVKVNKIDGNVTDVASGTAGTFHAKNLDLDDGHFLGTGTCNGQPVTLSGRVEAPDGKIVFTARIYVQFTTASGVGGRISGKQ